MTAAIKPSCLSDFTCSFECHELYRRLMEPAVVYENRDDDAVGARKHIVKTSTTGTDVRYSSTMTAS